MENKKMERTPTFIESLVILLLIIGTILYGIVGLGLSPHMPMFVTVIITVLYAFYLRIKWEKLEGAVFEGIKLGLQPMVLMVLIGMIIGSWIASGSIPYIIYLGIKVFSPRWFLVSALVVCSIMSFSTGSSWTTLGTLGVAFIGIGEALGVPIAMTAGAIVSGSVFGDKQSPLSETTNFAPAVAGTTLYEHIGSMLYSTGPAFLIAAILYIILGFKFVDGTVDSAAIDIILNAIESSFNLTPILLALPAILFVIVIFKIPALLGMGIAAVLGFVFAVVFQGVPLTDILSFMHWGYVADTGVDIVNTILSRGGLDSMMYTISLMFIALPLGGVLEEIGILRTLLDKLSGVISSAFGLVTTTLFTVLGLAALTADTYLPQMLAGRTFGPAYDKLNIDRKVLSRSLEDTGTQGSWMVPWSESGMFAFTTIGVSAFTYLPYYFLGIVTPFVSMILAATGFGMFYTNGKSHKENKRIMKDMKKGMNEETL